MEKVKYSLSNDVKTTVREINQALQELKNVESVSDFDPAHDRFKILMKELISQWNEFKILHSSGDLPHRSHKILTNLFMKFFNSDLYRDYIGAMSEVVGSELQKELPLKNLINNV
jgi:hypothetical protein